MRTIKGLTVKQWAKILGLPALIAAEFALILAFSGDVVNTAAFMVVIFVISTCITVYLTAAVNAYHEFRGERMSRKDLVTELTILKDEWGYYRGYIARTRTDIEDIWVELEKNGIKRGKE